MKSNKFIATLAMVAAIVCGCGQHHSESEEHGHEHGHSHEAQSDEHEHEHEHGGEGIALCAYSSSYELFAEVHPFVVSEDCDVAAHITSLADFKPVTEGGVSAVLTVGSTSDKASADAPTEDGIFTLEFEPSTVGEGTLSITYNGETMTVPVEVFSNDEDAHEAMEEAEVKSANGVAFTKEKSWSVDFATEEARLESFGQVIKTMARVENSQSDEQTVVAGASGIVSLTSLVEGQQVRNGQVICKIAGSGLSDNSLAVKYAEAESEYNLAKSDYERKQALAEDKIVSQSELQEAKGRYDSAKAAYDNLKKNFSSEGQSVKSSVDGFVRSVAVRNGEYVEAGQVIAVVAKSSNVVLRAEVQPKYYQSLRNISGATFSVLNSGKVWTLSELSGKVLGYGRGVSEGTNLIPVTFQVSNRADFLPGSFVQTYIHTTESGMTLTIPSTSIVEEMGDYFVFKQLTPEYFDKTQVKIGATDGIRTEILSGLEQGDRVVSRGAILVKLASSAGKLDAHSGHVH